MATQECRHVMPGGLNCKSPALRGSALCYHHARAQRTAPAPRPAESAIDMPIIFDAEGAAIAVNSILQALAANRISARRASILFLGVQMAASQQASSPVAFDTDELLSKFGFSPDNPDDMPSNPPHSQPPQQ